MRACNLYLAGCVSLQFLVALSVYITIHVFCCLCTRLRVFDSNGRHPAAGLANLPLFTESAALSGKYLTRGLYI